MVIGLKNHVSKRSRKRSNNTYMPLFVDVPSSIVCPLVVISLWSSIAGFIFSLPYFIETLKKLEKAFVPICWMLKTFGGVRIQSVDCVGYVPCNISSILLPPHTILLICYLFELSGVISDSAIVVVEGVVMKLIFSYIEVYMETFEWRTYLLVMMQNVSESESVCETHSI